MLVKWLLLEEIVAIHSSQKRQASSSANQSVLSPAPCSCELVHVQRPKQALFALALARCTKKFIQEGPANLCYGHSTRRLESIENNEFTDNGCQQVNDVTSTK